MSEPECVFDQCKLQLKKVARTKICLISTQMHIPCKQFCLQTFLENMVERAEDVS